MSSGSPCGGRRGLEYEWAKAYYILGSNREKVLKDP
jgi:hypothetical protein